MAAEVKVSDRSGRSEMSPRSLNNVCHCHFNLFNRSTNFLIVVMSTIPRLAFFSCQTRFNLGLVGRTIGGK
jgi:hypothetical protein